MIGQQKRKSELREEYESVFGVVEGSLGLYDADGSRIYNETSNGYWATLKRNADGNLLYLEDSDGVILDDRPYNDKVFIEEQTGKKFKLTEVR